MSDNKLVKTILDAATNLGRRNSHRHCRRHWLDWKKGCERKLHQRPHLQYHELCQIHRCHGW